MNKKKAGDFLLFAAIVAAFVFALARLFILRYEVGDVYPEYSSYRSDPLGTRALYGAISSLRKVSASRNLEPLTLIGPGRGRTLFIFAADLSEDPENTIRAIEEFVGDGGRLVITFFPMRNEPSYRLEPREKEEEKAGDAKKQAKQASPDRDGGSAESKEEKKDDESGKPSLTRMVSIEKRWGFTFAFWPLPKSGSGNYLPIRATKQAEPEALPASLSWHTALFFEKPDKPWRTLYSWDGRAVFVERPWKKGTIVLCSDSYFLSNEAMREERLPALLAWLIGSSSTVLFDETHFGIENEPGVMTLILRYHLHGLLVGLGVLAALFVWKNALSLLPKRGTGFGRGGQPAQGKDAAEGLVNLLRRSIPARRIIFACVEEWQRSFACDPKSKERKEMRIQAIMDREDTLPLSQRDPVRAYRDICAVLAERDWKREH